MNTVIIGVSGGSGSGKTYISEKLARMLKKENLSVREFHIDDYYINEKPIVIAPITQIKYPEYNSPEVFKIDEFFHDILNEKGKFDVLIIEGIMLLYFEKIRNLLDLKLFVECRSDERIVRRLRRNMEWGLSFDEISDYYLDLTRFRHDQFEEVSKWHADLFLNGSQMPPKGLDIIVNWIKQTHLKY